MFFLFHSQTHIYKIGREFSENGNELETCMSLLVFLEKKGVELKKSSLFNMNDSSLCTIPEVMDFQFWRYKIRYVLLFFCPEMKNFLKQTFRQLREFLNPYHKTQ